MCSKQTTLACARHLIEQSRWQAAQGLRQAAHYNNLPAREWSLLHGPLPHLSSRRLNSPPQTLPSLREAPAGAQYTDTEHSLQGVATDGSRRPF